MKKWKGIDRALEPGETVLSRYSHFILTDRKLFRYLPFRPDLYSNPLSGISVN